MYCFALQLQLTQSAQNFVAEIGPYLVWSLVGVAVLVVIVDIFLYTSRTRGETISRHVRDWSYGRGFVLPFIWGVLATHFFLVGQSSSSRPEGWIAIAAIVLSMILIGVYRKPRVTPFSQVIMLVFGVTASFLLIF